MQRKESVYAVIGGVVGAVLTLAVCSVMPLGAQNRDATFGEITCTKLKVVDSEAERGGVIVLYDGGVVIGDKNGSATLSTDEHGGRLNLFGKNRQSLVICRGLENGGNVSVYDKDWGLTGGSAQMAVDGYGGSVTVYAKGSHHNLSNAGMSVNEYGNGMVYTWNKNADGAAQMEATEYGGLFWAIGKGSKRSQVEVGVNEYGNGTVGTWNKNGYRLADLK